MTTINFLATLGTLSGGDSFPVYAANQGDARKVSATNVAAFMATNMSDVVIGNYVKVTPVTVQNLPSAVDAGTGARAFVTDANGTTFNNAVAGGGSNEVPVFSDGAVWRIG